MTGLIASANGFTLVQGSSAATALCRAGVALPFVCGAAVLGVLTAFLGLHPGPHEAAGRPDSVEEEPAAVHAEREMPRH
ncbi:MAG TPA: hypothetical protein VGO89_17080 [Streptomyces sp.]|nr:hypothetical protein [Streptomyces sp.]